MPQLYLSSLPNIKQQNYGRSPMLHNYFILDKDTLQFSLLYRHWMARPRTTSASHDAYPHLLGPGNKIQTLDISHWQQLSFKLLHKIYQVAKNNFSGFLSTPPQC
jgi:hypothetical protein